MDIQNIAYKKPQNVQDEMVKLLAEKKLIGQSLAGRLCSPAINCIAGGMMPYLFCLVVDIVTLACIAFLGWLIWKGATTWLILAMLLLGIMPIFPGRDIFTCPKCGNVAEVKVYKAGLDTTACVQKDKNDPDD